MTSTHLSLRQAVSKPFLWSDAVEPMTIDYFFMIQHRRLRARFSMATMTRHENAILAALSKRHASQRQA